MISITDGLTGLDSSYGTGLGGNSVVGASYNSIGAGRVTSLGPGGGEVEHATTAAYQSGGSVGLGHGAHGAGVSGAVHVPLDHTIATADNGPSIGFNGISSGHELMNDVINSVGGHTGVANSGAYHHVGLGFGSGAVSNSGGGHGITGSSSHSDVGPVGASVSYGPVNSFGGFDLNGKMMEGGHWPLGGHESYGDHGPYGGHDLYGDHGSNGGHGSYGDHGSVGDHGLGGRLSNVLGSIGGEHGGIMNRLSELVGHGNSHEGAEILSNLIESPEHGYRVTFAENHSGHDGFDGYHAGSSTSGYEHDLGLNHLADMLGEQHVGLNQEVLGRLATVVGHGNVHDGAQILSRLVETSGHVGLGTGHGDAFGNSHGHDEPIGMTGYGSHGGMGIEEEARQKWWTLKNLLHDIGHGENIGSLIANVISSENGFGGHGNHWVGFPGFPVSLFNGHGMNNDAFHIPGSPFEITMDGKVRLVEGHSHGFGGWQDMNHPFSDFTSDGNRWGGMTMILNRGQGKGPYLLDHWGNSVDLADGHHQGFVMTGHDGHKYLFVPTSAVTGHHASGDDFHNGGWHDGHQTVLTPAGLMDLTPASHWNPTADGEHGPVLHTPSGDMTLGPHGPEVLDSPLGPLHLLPSHDGVMHLETPEVCFFSC